MASRFKMQILDTETGELAQWAPGGPVETDFVEDCIKRVVEASVDLPAFDLSAFSDAVLASAERRGVGLGRTTAHVKGDVQDAIREAVLDGHVDKVFTEAKRLATEVLEQCIKDAIHALKTKVRP